MYMFVCASFALFCPGKGETNEQEGGPLGGGVPQDKNAGSQSEVHATTTQDVNASSVGQGHFHRPRKGISLFVTLGSSSFDTLLSV